MHIARTCKSFHMGLSAFIWIQFKQSDAIINVHRHPGAEQYLWGITINSKEYIELAYFAAWGEGSLSFDKKVISTFLLQYTLNIAILYINVTVIKTHIACFSNIVQPEWTIIPIHSLTPRDNLRIVNETNIHVFGIDTRPDPIFKSPTAEL